MASSTNKDTGPKKVFYLGVFRVNKGQQAVELAADRDLSSFSWITQTSVGQGITFAAKTIAERTAVGARNKVEENTSDVHAFHSSIGVCAVMITESSYDQYAGQGILSKTIDDFKSRFTPSEIRDKAPGTFDWPQLKQLRIEAITAPGSGIAAVQKELNDTKIVLHQTIQSVLERGEKLDELVAKSDELNSMSKTFYKTAKQQNSCCVVM